ncbi:hypothetical protein HPB50_005745 [Hyalomma asiaticum]|uniref:Uncharacterized protein n=1 Tax=Hyalomma asiaticum TaxID=266040 RepID=A0ACB7SKE4_HYAAI|nr:hypothetical protein HPB50_005745 [Hyalomma asiaticum]
MVRIECLCATKQVEARALLAATAWRSGFELGEEVSWGGPTSSGWQQLRVAVHASRACAERRRARADCLPSRSAPVHLEIPFDPRVARPPGAVGTGPFDF